MREYRLLIFLILFPYVCIAQHSAPRYAIKNVTIISMLREEPMLNQTVLIDSGYISKIEPTAKVKIDRGYTIIDGSGKYLLPGLFDMHVHFHQDFGNHVNITKPELELMLAKGITMARVMYGHPDHMRASDNVRNGNWAGPELSVVSPAIAGSWLVWDPTFMNYELVHTADNAKKVVKRFKRQGYTAIKLGNMVSKEVFEAVTKAAQEEEIKVVGHAGSYVKLSDALNAKMQIEHLSVFMEALLPDRSYYTNEVGYNGYTTCAVDTIGISYLDVLKIPSVAQTVKKAGTYVTPTLNQYRISEDEIAEKPEYAYIPLSQKKRGGWNTKIAKQQVRNYRQRVVEIRKKIVYELWKAGVPLMAGSEHANVNGFSIHDELSAMVDAGLTPYAALQTATINPATYLNKEQQVGTVEVGKRAILLLLDKNPLIDIHNTQAIVGLFKGFSWYDQSAIEKMLEETKILGN